MSCNHIISDSEIESIYKIDTTHNVNFVKNDCRFSNTSKYVFLKVKKDSEEILDKPIVWEYVTDARLYSNIEQRDKVAKYEHIQIKSEFRNESLAKKYDERAYEVYKRNNFKEIQLSAIKDGVVVWPKLFYKFVSERDEKEILRYFEKYLVKVHNYVDNEARNDKMRKINKILDIPKNLLVPSEKISFSSWLAEETQRTKKSLLFKLYKEVS